MGSVERLHLDRFNRQIVSKGSYNCTNVIQAVTDKSFRTKISFRLGLELRSSIPAGTGVHGIWERSIHSTRFFSTVEEFFYWIFFDSGWGGSH
jgi:hypothetical protein